ncbi:hypothetical protein I8748_34385 [Nostoc sp. CENA67]|uniref:Uncharacterized protein n=1 Tax=Amazonocrinis nigriterrae CENA67 TaxID=2794033 RepID=A0A8J7HZL8_9NOST|nr:hypothetical protein [Amazonocrinis nigriterrae]MBH8567180.1 hypothetical protein [Amazonocrinis nigriterrae CENA67]
MLVQTIQSEIFVELSTEQQQLLSGGQFGGFPPRQSGGGGQGGQLSFPGNRPDISVRGILTTADGQSFPIRLLGFREDF